MQNERMATIHEIEEARLWAKWMEQIKKFNDHNTAQIMGFEEEVA